ncbi:LAME_0B02894g1_1 [Lachancea meyersii CBS 8951]|uniref:LAME_0B02894g1_1 n=1 Tax=Lachancea meyersii CBS 8951 TaxID=1266667 RepID=A0A1G4ITT0_9SACH|nr:LAME_0B02894g1_1 [Lachancea meyersii CBS 8951]
MGDQQVVFMSPQTENLDYLYSLVDRVSQQMTENKKKRAALLREIDVLVNEVNRSSLKKPPRDTDFEVISSFLKQRNIQVQEPVTHRSRSDAEEIENLREQNSVLKSMLQEKSNNNNEMLTLLKVHEGCLSDVVSLLRRDVLSYHQGLINKCRELYQDRICVLEDEEFKEYMENVTDVQELLDMSEIFRLLLRMS